MFFQVLIALTCLLSLAIGDAQYGLPGGFGAAPIAPFGGFGAAPIAPLGGFGGAPIAPYGRPLGGYGPGPLGAGIGGFGGAPYGSPVGAFGPAPLGGAIGGLGAHAGLGLGGVYGPAPFRPAYGGYQQPGYFAPANYQFGYGVQTNDYYGAASFGHNEERNAYGTNGHYHVNTPASFQSVTYNVPELGAGYGAAPIPAYG